MPTMRPVGMPRPALNVDWLMKRDRSASLNDVLNTSCTPGTISPAYSAQPHPPADATTPRYQQAPGR